MMNFSETFAAASTAWIEQNIAQVAPEEIDASGADALHVQSIEAIINPGKPGQL